MENRQNKRGGPTATPITLHPETTNSQPYNQPKPRWIMSNRDLPNTTAPARYKITPPDAEPREITLSKRKRQVVEALMMGSLYCASTVRIGDVVFRLTEAQARTIVGLHYAELEAA